MISALKKDKINAWIKAADYYRKADAMLQNTNKNYALTNLLELDNILVQARKYKWAGATTRSTKMLSLRAAKEKMGLLVKDKTKPEVDMDFWDMARIANASLCLWLLEGKNTGEMTEKRVVDAYLKVWNLAGSQNKKVAEMEHLDFLRDAYSTLARSEKVVKTINKIKSDLKNFLK